MAVTSTRAPDAVITGGESPRALAARYGLGVSGARPTLPDYARTLWQRRHFIASYAQARLAAVYMTARLGQVWQLLTPLMNAAVYFLIFGLILHTNRGIPDFIGFLCTGVFAFNFTQQTVLSGTRSIADSMNLIRALHFPRACLPISVMLTQLQQLAFAIVALLVIVKVSGGGPSRHVAMMLPALACQAVFSAGLAMIVARIGAKNTDMAQVMPFVMRTWMYLSGVFYDIHSLTRIPTPIRIVLEHNPMAIYMDLMRQSLHVLKPHTGPPAHAWAFALGWALLVGAGGFVYFWHAEQEYGRG